MTYLKITSCEFVFDKEAIVDKKKKQMWVQQ